MSSADLRQQLERVVAQLVASGRYGWKSKGLGLIQHREAQLAALDASVARGLADTAAGHTKSAAEMFDRLEAKYAGMLGRSA